MAVKKKTTKQGPKALLMKKNVDQLKRKAKQLGVKNYSTKKKAQLVQSIMLTEARKKKKTGKRKTVKKTVSKPISRAKIRMNFSLNDRRPTVKRSGMRKQLSGYNGWSNYETWLVNLHFSEYFSELAMENQGISSYDLGQMLSEVVNDYTFEVISHDNYFLSDMANAFLSAVDYRELAEAAKDE